VLHGFIVYQTGEMKKQMCFWITLQPRL
jgi:hypothetical protein